MANPFRILSLDGGGPWSLIQARTLGAIFAPDMPGRELLSHFDLVISNSGGAVVVAGLLANMTTESIVTSCFANQARLHQIFMKTTPTADPVADILRPLGLDFYEYSTVAKLAALRDVLGTVADTHIPDLPSLFPQGLTAPKFIFTAFGYDRLREVHFRSDPASPAASDTHDAPLTLAEAVHASSNAPLLYFDAPAIVGVGTGSVRFWDGGVGGYNNPVLQGVVEAIAYGVPRETIQVISLGSGTVMQPLASEFPNADPALVRATPGYSLARDVNKIAGAIIDDPPDAASLHAYLLLGRPLPPRVGGVVQSQGTAGFVRFSPLIRPHLVNGAWQAPRNFQGTDWTTLSELELICIEPAQIALLQKLTDCWMASDPLDIPNQPVRLTWPTFACELGCDSFADALAVAQGMFNAPVA
jgi:uncharacterized protein